jgi:hypothetical protein
VQQSPAAQMTDDAAAALAQSTWRPGGGLTLA